MKEVWKCQRLGDLLSIQNGYAFDSKSFGVTGMPLIRIRDLRIGLSTETCFDGEFDPRYIVKAGDFLIGMDGEFGCFEWKGQAALLNQRVCRLQEFGHALEPRFLFYGINAHLKAIEDITGYTTVKHISSKQVLDINMPVPTKNAQRRIVAILDEAFEGITTAKANAEKNMLNSLEVFESERETLLSRPNNGWCEAHLRDLCDIKHGYAFDGEFFASAGTHVLLTPGNFFEAGGYRDRGAKQKYYVGSIPDNFVLSEGDLLVAMTEQAAGLLGSPLLVPEADRFLHNQRLGLAVGKQGAPWLNDYFFQVFNLRRVREEIHASASGAKVRHTSPSKIGDVLVAYPRTIEEQRIIATKLANLSILCDEAARVFERKLAALDELKKSLLHHAFSGQLSA